MANQPPRSGGSKDKDDDSWGKLASDLFGIQFGAPSDDDDDDFDLTDDEPAAAPPVSAPVGLAAVEPISVDEEPDVSFPEDDDDDIVTPVVRTESPRPAARPERKEVRAERVEPPEAKEPAPEKGDEAEKDIWDLLESWNWDEPNREARSRSADDQQSTGSTSGGRPRGDRRDDRGPKRERPRDRDRDRGGDRPARPRTPEAATPEAETRESRPRREDRPRRPESTDRDQQRSERPAAEAPRPARAPEQAERRPSRRPERSSTTRSDDDFASGISDSAAAPPASEKPRTPRPPRRQPEPPREVEVRADSDEFADDLFVEAADDSVEVAFDSEGSEAESPAGNDEPRRRRRRRRRGGRSRRDGAPREEGVVDEVTEPDEAGDEFAEETAAEPAEEASEDEGGREARRPRRRRRRVRRRPEEQAPPVEVQDGDIEEEVAISEDEIGDEESFADDDEEAPVVVSYEGIPSWEEAISYLQRRPRDARPRSEGSSRGRGGPHRR